ncbi:MAG: outer membrane protein assembly factor BamD [Calditrichaeota bacterium]|nr:MAG: outer membrane protein assembly factor BamD [Calditrichota bacterium]MBL1206910.1 outer membrane protein assembly factor BamD [Calditrichota bacterium]NOG46736.1 tetratricopeptide repeat protein [Calditrichota bacterium]
MKKIIYSLIVLFLFAQSNYALDALDDEANKLYQDGYKLILDKDWNSAIETFEKLLDKYSDSSWEDDATFWICYAHEKKGRKKENSFECYEDFIKDFEDSKWRDDALQNMAKIAQEIGNSDYTTRVKNLENELDDELSLAAIRALSSRGDTKAFESIIRIFNSNKKPGLRKKMVYIIGSFETSASAKKLMEIAEDDADKDVRREAIFWLSNNEPTEEIADFLVNSALNDKDRDVQKKALFSLSNMDNQFGIPYLYKIAEKHSNDDLRADAIFWIGQNSEDLESLKKLSNFAREDKAFAVQKKAIFAISQIETSTALDELVILSKELKNKELRANALFWLSQNATSKKHIGAIRDAAYNDKDGHVQEKAVFALHQLEKNKGLDDLIKIAKDHPSSRIRKKAIFWLGQSDDDRAIDALEDILMAPKK